MPHEDRAPEYDSRTKCRTPVTPFLPIGDAAYCQHAKGGLNHGHRQHAQKIGKDCACGSGDILADRQTHRQTYSSQYFATAPAGKVTSIQPADVLRPATFQLLNLLFLILLGNGSSLLEKIRIILALLFLLLLPTKAAKQNPTIQ